MGDLVIILINGGTTHGTLGPNPHSTISTMMDTTTTATMDGFTSTMQTSGKTKKEMMTSGSGYRLDLVIILITGGTTQGYIGLNPHSTITTPMDTTTTVMVHISMFTILIFTR